MQQNILGITKTIVNNRKTCHCTLTPQIMLAVKHDEILLELGDVLQFLPVIFYAYIICINCVTFSKKLHIIVHKPYDGERKVWNQ